MKITSAFTKVTDKEQKIYLYLNRERTCEKLNICSY